MSSDHTGLMVYDRWMDRVASACMLIAGVALVYLTVIFGWLVYGRYILNATPTWVEQAALLLIVLIGFLGTAVGVHQKTHLSVAYFADKMPRPVQRLFEFTSHLLMGVFGGIMAFYSYKLAVFKWGSDIPLLHLPEGLRALPIMVSGALVVLFTIGHLLHFFLDEAPSSNLSDEGV